MSSQKRWIGTCIGGRYQVESLLGQGGMGNVYLAEDLKLKGKKWAVKECLPYEDDVASFMEEAEMLACLQHPQLPQLVDYFTTDEGIGFLVMDYIHGPTLQDMFDAQRTVLSVNEIVHIALQLCDLFHYLHTFQPQPIIYRDLKPSNVMINENDQVRLIDFGVARHYTQGKQSDTMQMGTIGFAAPEQFLGFQTDERSDLYTLGANLYYLLSGGQYAYMTKKTLDQICSNLPEGLTSTVTLLLQENPQDRCQTAMEVKQRLKTLLPDLLLTDSYKQTKKQNMNHKPDVLSSIPDQLIIVGGLYAGVGATFTAISLARILNAMEIPNALVEHPTIEPDLYMLLFGDRKAPQSYSFATKKYTEQQARSDEPWTSGHTTWVPLDPNGWTGEWHSTDSFKLLYTIKKPIVLWDVSTRWEDLSVRELCHSADHILVVLDTSPAKCSRPSARAYLEILDTYRKRGKKVHFVANRSDSGQLPKEWVNALPEAPLCTLPEIPYEEVMRAVWKGDCIQDQANRMEQLYMCLTPLLKAILPESIHKNNRIKTKKSLFSGFRKHG
ncbi:serine/threonine-protein kinase [Paenibacillus sp. N3.4]|uniref:serine/threonine-protein kinase n=1 Tax=Paenibacillus sp. N3.4 TaxID=2603222 RepID=UPI00164FD4C0|nr:serine/threonine-protein kinase [Paenibacillus sp. N3.4]